MAHGTYLSYRHLCRAKSYTPRYAIDACWAGQNPVRAFAARLLNWPRRACNRTPHELMQAQLGWRACRRAAGVGRA
eukprot:scaffold10082_cov115-Isochrysis_galbana.AAC.3